MPLASESDELAGSSAQRSVPTAVTLAPSCTSRSIAWPFPRPLVIRDLLDTEDPLLCRDLTCDPLARTQGKTLPLVMLFRCLLASGSGLRPQGSNNCRPESANLRRGSLDHRHKFEQLLLRDAILPPLLP